jgi:hypothetical protein
MRGMFKTIVTLAIIGAALYFTNPTMDDFGTYYERKQVAASQKGVRGVLADITKAVAQTGANLVIQMGFTRADSLLFSTFTLGPSKKPSEQYIGLAKVIFIEVK